MRRRLGEPAFLDQYGVQSVREPRLPYKTHVGGVWVAWFRACHSQMARQRSHARRWV